MSLMPLTKEFGNAAQFEMGAHHPAMAQWHAPRQAAQNSSDPTGKQDSEAETIKEYNKARLSELVGNKIETNARPDNLSASGLAAIKAQTHHYRQLVGIVNSASWNSLASSLGKLSFSLSDLRAPEAVQSLQTSRENAQQRHINAAQEIPIKPHNVALDPLTGMPMTAERFEWMNKKGMRCGGKFTADNLVGGAYAHTDFAGDYYNKDKLEESQDALDLQQTHDSLLEQIADGTIEYETMNPEEQLIILQAQPLAKRMERYAGQNLSAQEIEKLEESVHEFQQENRPDFIGELSRSKPLVTVNDGAVKPGAYSPESLNSAFKGVAYNMAPISAQFAAPVGAAASVSFSAPPPKQPDLAPGM